MAMNQHESREYSRLAAQAAGAARIGMTPHETVEITVTMRLNGMAPMGSIEIEAQSAGRILAKVQVGAEIEATDAHTKPIARTIGQSVAREVARILQGKPR